MTVSTMLSPYKFDADDADIVLLSGDHESPEQFRVHRCILSLASPFFHDMFTLPQGSLSEELPIIPVSEKAEVLDTLLRFVYPLPDPILASLNELAPVLDAAVKYELITVVTTLRKLLISPSFVQLAPLRAYAIACRHDFEEEAKVISRFTLSTNLLDGPLSDDLKEITAYSYHRLLDLHRRRSLAAQAIVKVSDDIKCMQCNASAFTTHGAPKWWYEFEKRAREELAVRPTSDVVFGTEFLAGAAFSTGCIRCPGSVMESWKFLRDLKATIDELPSTI